MLRAPVFNDDELVRRYLIGFQILAEAIEDYFIEVSFVSSF